MRKFRFVVLAAFLAAGLASATAMAYEFNTNTIVVSDNWCAPWNDGTCYTCNTGRVIIQATCRSSYCDNMTYLCHNPPIVNGTQLALHDGNIWTDWTSDENGQYSTNAACPVGYAMIGMNSYGNYSDNIRSICRAITIPDGMTMYRLSNSNYITDEGGTFSALFWLMGASCTGSYCSHMYYYEAFMAY
jgi:hypothetical protein